MAASVAVLLASQALRWSPVIGFLLTGMLIGPSGLGLVGRDDVERFAEIGVVILLFTLGLEFSLATLRQSWRPFLLGGGGQVLATVALAALAATLCGLTVPEGIFVGFLVALSSTAIVLQSYAERRELRAPQGVLATGILLFQDFSLAPMIVLVPVLAGGAQASPLDVLGRLGFGVLLVAVAFAVARLVMPPLLHGIVRTRVREIFLLGALGVCLAMAMLTARLGFSLALGAFLAGLLLSESEYGHQVTAEVLPFRDLFNSLFFVSLGMLLDLGTLGERWLAVLAIVAAIAAGKTLVTAGVVLGLGFPVRTALVAGVSLAQVGEFSFVLAAAGHELGMLDTALHQSLLAASVLTMLATPFAIALVPRLATRVPELRRARAPSPAASSAADGPAELSGHAILVGYGLNGQNVSRVLRETAIPFVVLELDGQLVRRAHADRIQVVYGDATRGEILEVCGVRKASLLVLAISDLAATRQAVRVGRSLNPDLHILVRTRAVSEVDELRRLGADEVIPEEFETSIEIFCRVLERYHVPRNIIDAQVHMIRDQGYSMLRSSAWASHEALDRIAAILQETLTETFLVRSGAHAEGQTLRQLDLRGRTGASVIAIVRDGDPTTNPSPDEPLRAHDTLVLVGGHAALEAAFHALETG